jgi:large subunit ribosomal protein L6
MGIKNHITIKVPKTITCYICNSRNFIFIQGKVGSKMLKFDDKILLSIEKGFILIQTNFSFLKNYYNLRKKVVGLQTKFKSLILKVFIDVSRKTFKKLKLVGIGFKVNCIEYEGLRLLKLDIGFSHSIYYRIPKDISVIVISPTKFIVSSDSIDRVGKISSIIRKLKLPEQYKGKGILYSDEHILLKEIKKS